MAAAENTAADGAAEVAAENATAPAPAAGRRPSPVQGVHAQQRFDIDSACCAFSALGFSVLRLLGFTGIARPFFEEHMDRSSEQNNSDLCLASVPCLQQSLCHAPWPSPDKPQT